MTTMFLDFFEAFLSVLVRLFDFLFSLDVYDTVSIGDLLVAIFISRLAFTILIKGANVGIDSLQTRHAAASRRKEVFARKKGG